MIPGRARLQRLRKNSQRRAVTWKSGASAPRSLQISAGASAPEVRPPTPQDDQQFVEGSPKVTFHSWYFGAAFDKVFTSESPILGYALLNPDRMIGSTDIAGSERFAL